MYSGKLMRSKPLTESLFKLLLKINELIGAEYNGILINKYMDGCDYIGAHSDDETGLDPIGVVSVSYGAERTFRIRDKVNKKIVYEDISKLILYKDISYISINGFRIAIL